MRRPRASGDEVLVIGSERLLDELEVAAQVGGSESSGARHAGGNSVPGVETQPVAGDMAAPEVVGVPGPYQQDFEVQERKSGQTRERARRLGALAAAATAVVLAAAVWVGTGDQRGPAPDTPVAARVASPELPAPPPRPADGRQRRASREHGARRSRVEDRPHKPERKPEFARRSPARGVGGAAPAGVLVPPAAVASSPPVSSGAPASSAPPSSEPPAAATGAEVREEFGP